MLLPVLAMGPQTARSRRPPSLGSHECLPAQVESSLGGMGALPATPPQPACEKLDTSGHFCHLRARVCV